MAAPKSFLKTATGKATAISSVTSILTILVTAILNSCTINETKKINACVENRALANTLIEMTISMTHLAQNKLNVNLGECYVANGKAVQDNDPFLWAEFEKLRSDTDLMTAKVAVLGNDHLTKSYIEYRQSLVDFTSYCGAREKSFDGLWKKLTRETCEFNYEVGKMINKCLDIENIPINCPDSE